jgi:hypothetical protein
MTGDRGMRYCKTRLGSAVRDLAIGGQAQPPAYGARRRC